MCHLLESCRRPPPPLLDSLSPPLLCPLVAPPSTRAVRTSLPPPLGNLLSAVDLLFLKCCALFRKYIQCFLIHPLISRELHATHPVQAT